MAATKKAAQKRPRSPQERKNAPPVELSSESVRAAVLHLVRLAVLYEGTLDAASSVGSLSNIGGMPGAERVLADVVDRLGQHQRELKNKYIDAARIVWLMPTLRPGLDEYRKLTPRERKRAEDQLRKNITEEFRAVAIRISEPHLTGILKAATELDDDLMTRVLGAAGEIVGFSGGHLANLRGALHGKPRQQAAVKSQADAEALLNEEGGVPSDALRYFLDALTRGSSPALVEELVGVWNAHWEGVAAASRGQN